VNTPQDIRWPQCYQQYGNAFTLLEQAIRSLRSCVIGSQAWFNRRPTHEMHSCWQQKCLVPDPLCREAIE